MGTLNDTNEKNITNNKATLLQAILNEIPT